MGPGWYCCYTTCCGYNKIMVMVSKNSIRYQCPVVNVPTKDNVRIAVDVGVNFHIGRIAKRDE